MIFFNGVKLNNVVINDGAIFGDNKIVENNNSFFENQFLKMKQKFTMEEILEDIHTMAKLYKIDENKLRKKLKK